LAEKSWEIGKIFINNQEFVTASQTYRLDKNEAIYGLGQRQEGTMNHRGKTLKLIQTNTVAVVPFLISTKNYGIYWDNYSKTIFEDNEDGCTFSSEAGDGVDYYLVAGENMDDVIAGYRNLTGQAPMFGKWAFGYWQSKERYKDDKDILSVVKEFRERNFPIDNIVQDWCYWGDDDDMNTVKALWSSMYFHPASYSDPARTIGKIKNKYKMHYMISIWPALGQETEIYKELSRGGLMLPPKHWSTGYLYDAYSEKARNIYWKHIRKGLISNGVDALWMDGTEPEVMNQHTFDTSHYYIKTLGETSIGHMAKYLNTYSLMTTEGVYRNFTNENPEKRFFILTRSAFAGQQRNAAVTWSGDINARFDVMRDQISSGLNFCMAGIPYWTHDIGAFFVEGRDYGDGPAEYPGGVENDAYKELYVRWFQFGAFTPIFRSHGTQTPREPWQFGEPGTWAYDALLKSANLRYRLLPYIYSTAWKVSNEGYTLMRGLAMDFPEDEKVWNIDNAYMFGPSFLVCPVTEHQYFPIEGKTDLRVKSVEVYLPASTAWYHFFTGKRFDGGQRISVETPIDEFPLFIKAGSVIPMGPFKHYAGEIPEDPIELRIYPGADGTFVLYEDENDNLNYQKGIYATIPFSWDDNSKVLTIGKRKGGFPGMLRERIFNIVLVKENLGIGVEICSPDKVIRYEGDPITITF
jgi:alpha-D-xyloside xylohydrolase